MDSIAPTMAKAGKPTYRLTEQEAVRVALRKILDEKGTKKAVADLLGVRPQSILKIVDQGGGPSVETVRRLAEYLKVTEAELLSGGASSDRPAGREVEYLRRYQNAELAAEVARREALLQEAIRDVVDGAYKLDADAPPSEWFDAIKLRDSQLRRARKGLAQDTERASKEREVSAEHVEKMKRTGKPKLSVVKPRKES